MARSKDKVRLDITISKEMNDSLVKLSHAFTEKGLEIHTKSQILEEAFRLYVIFLSERVEQEMKKEEPKEEN